ncbi:hypothetical protein AAC387_Pa07g2295 [Persea americana]
MDVVFETSKGRQFAIEVGFFDTVLEMKEKIQKYEGFPVSQQTLVFKDQVMVDDRDTEFYEIIQGSHIRLFIESETIKPTMIEEPSKIHLTLRIPASKRQFSIDVDATCSVAQLKERIHEMEGIPSSRLVLLISGNTELQDHRSLSDYGIFDDSDVNVIFKPFPPPTQPPLRRLKVTVQSMCGTKKVPVEVNASDNVSELRKELERLHQNNHLHLPKDGYFFICKQNVMEDDRTFRWHDVRQGDVIEIFNGSVTGGS